MGGVPLLVALLLVRWCGGRDVIIILHVVLVDDSNLRMIIAADGPSRRADNDGAKSCFGVCVRRFDPRDDDGDTMGFFLAKFRKIK